MPVPFLNRDAILVKPKKAYVDWMRRIDREAEEEESENLIEACETIYLIEELEHGSHAEAAAYLEKNWTEIADSEFSAWSEDESEWPDLKSLNDFEEYFEWNHVEMIHDLARCSLTRE